MRSLESPEAPSNSRLRWFLVLAAAAIGLVGWFVADRLAPSDSPGAPSRQSADGTETSAPAAPGVPDDTPSSANVVPDGTERLGRNGTPASAPRASRGAGAPARPATAPAATPTAPRELRVTADVDGAYVFLDRKFLGSTPLVSRDVAPGTYQLNVQMAGRPPVVRTIDVAGDGTTEVAVTLAASPSTAAAQFSADVAVVHQHGVGSCEGTLRADGDGFRYETTHQDAFSLPFAGVETFVVEYQDKRLRLKQRGGRTWNFTTRAGSADPLFVFHRDVEAFRNR